MLCVLYGEMWKMIFTQRYLLRNWLWMIRGAETGHITIPHTWNISMAGFSTSYSFPDHDFHQRSDYVFVFGLVFLLHYSADLIWERRSPRLRLMVALYLLKTAK